MFKGTFFVKEDTTFQDNDWIGIVFAYQSSSQFYLLTSTRDDMKGKCNERPCNQGNWQLKLVNSATGPHRGIYIAM